MHKFKRWLQFYLNASCHVAFAVVSLTIITFVEFSIAFNTAVLGFVFFSTIAAYNFVKYIGIDKAHFTNRTSNLHLIILLTIVSCLLSFYWMTFLKLEALAVILISGLITWFYAFPKSPFRLFSINLVNLRMIPGIKVYLVALVWTLITILLPLVQAGEELNAKSVLALLQRWLLVVVLMLPFEIRDLQFDALKLQTIPQQLGVTITKLLGFVMIIAIALLEYFKFREPSVYTLSLLLFLMTAAVVVFYSKRESSFIFTALWVESLPLFWLGLVLFFEFFLNT